MAFLAVVAIPALWLAVKTVRVTTAMTLAESMDTSDLRKAIAIDGGNPRAYQRLGLIHTYSLADFDPDEAVRCLRRATELSPNAARYWLQLAGACEAARDTGSGNSAIAHALELRPMSPSFRWRAANYYLRTAQSELAWVQFRRLLKLSPGYAPAAFRLCLGVSGDPHLVIDKILPADPDPALNLAYVNFLSTQGQVDFAHRVWVRTAASGRAFPFRQGGPYLEHLLALRRYSEAIEVWKDLVHLGAVTQPADADGTNLVFNGGFEQPPLNAGFGWRSSKADFLAIDFGDRAAYEGAACLRLDFTVKHNAEHKAPYQFVAVTPGQTYHLRAFARSDGITSDSGPRLRVQDPACPRCLDVSSQNTVGSTPWHRIGLTFSVGLETRVVRLSVWRPRSRTFPTQITGIFWLDSVSLKPVDTRAESSPHNSPSQP